MLLFCPIYLIHQHVPEIGVHLFLHLKFPKLAFLESASVWDMKAFHLSLQVLDPVNPVDSRKCIIDNLNFSEHVRHR
jgi:hypothetical protein